MMGSFGPVVALSSLSNNLNQTLASGERVLSLLEKSDGENSVDVKMILLKYFRKSFGRQVRYIFRRRNEKCYICL